jgi:hypothetical protein
MDKFQTHSRPALRWAAIPAFLWLVVDNAIVSTPMGETETGLMLAFIAALYGLRGYEKLKGVE